jgi:rRNA-processing protein FCF1
MDQPGAAALNRFVLDNSLTFYLELAMREGLPIATLDQQLREAAARVGVPEFLP